MMTGKSRNEKMIKAWRTRCRGACRALMIPPLRTAGVGSLWGAPGGIRPARIMFYTRAKWMSSPGGVRHFLADRGPDVPNCPKNA